MDILKLAKQQRGVVKGQLTRLGNYIDQLMNGAEVSGVLVRFETFKTLWARYEEQQNIIDANVTEGELKAQTQERTLFEEEYFDIGAKYQEWISAAKKFESSGCVNPDAESSDSDGETRKTTHDNAQGSSATARGLKIGGKHSKIGGAFKLPPVELPTFSGDISGWQSYIELFDSLIHKNDSLSAVNKLFYLKSTLRGESLRVIGSLAITGANYEEARRLLRNRYDNSRCLIQSHLSGLFNLPEARPRSVSSLRALIDDVNRHLASLRSLGERVDDWNTIVVYLISTKLDNETRRLFETEFVDEIPNYTELVSFLDQRCRALERFDPPKAKLMSKSFSVANVEGKRSSHLVGLSSKRCAYCSTNGHRIYECTEFLGLEASERYKAAVSRKLCFKCLNKGHLTTACKGKACFRCGKGHHTLLHFVKTVVEPAVSAESPSSSGDQDIGVATFKSVANSQVILYTMKVRVASTRGGFVEARALLDTGSQSCFVTKGLIDRLGSDVRSLSVNVEGICGRVSEITQAASLTIQAKNGSTPLFINALIIPRISGDLPRISLPSHLGSPFAGLNLADPQWNIASPVDLLLSNAIFSQIVRSGICRQSFSDLLALETSFGWIIGGRSEQASSNSIVSTVSSVVMCSLDDLSGTVEKFWSIEEFPTSKFKDCDPSEKFFEGTVRRDETGRFVVRLPFKVDQFVADSSMHHARSRFTHLERKLNNDPHYRKLYTDFINEFRLLGIFEKVDKVPCDKYFYMPHHGVLTKSESSMKLRCVFDGSATPPGSTSLNSVLHTGPKLQMDLVKIFLKFRVFAVAFVADIEKMFCQISVDERDRNYLRFFWRDFPSQPVDIFRHTRLPFGLTCSPFMAIACLKRLAAENALMFPDAARLITENMYVDDLIAGAESLPAAKKVIEDMNGVLGSAGFHLRGWATNDSDLSSNLGCKECTHPFEIFGDPKTVLGLVWDPVSDEISFKAQNLGEAGHTKRIILSQLAKFFDPLGLLSPIIVRGKMIMQELWTQNLGWDERVSTDFIERWDKILNEISILKNLKVMRLLPGGKERKLCGFTDASVRAYGAAIYWVSSEGCSLILAKSKVAPLKTVTLARLELCAACLGARLMRYASETLDVAPSECFMFADSQIVLAWLSKPAFSWKAFVANRISQIQESIPGVRWSYVKSKDNPADLVSRGTTPQQLISHTLWWQGPNWLKSFNGDVSSYRIPNTDCEKRMTMVGTVETPFIIEVIKRYSGYVRAVRVIAMLFRFFANSRRTMDERIFGPVTPSEFEAALMKIVSSVQDECFSSSISRLKGKRMLDSGDRLAPLSPFLDESGILRLGGRLQQSFLNFEEKHPIILPKVHHFVEILITYEHCHNYHMGPNFLIGKLRRRFWILDSRSVINRVIRRCVICCRYNPKPAIQLMGELPKDRVKMTRPFDITGVDLCGPFLTRPVRGRGRTTFKSYVALFVCFAVKAVHLEFVVDLSTDAFISALRRFVARRGCPSIIWSDNATNFVGTNNYLAEWRQLLMGKESRKVLEDELAREGITWKFTPPRSPSFGGIWESQIKVFKRCFEKTVGAEKLSIDEMQTLMCQIEGCMNSRPLCRLTGSTDDLDVLTPNHFLFGQGSGLLFDNDGTNCGGYTARWRHLQMILAHYWKRWTAEYLRSLQCRNKARKTYENVSIGDIGVLVRENCPTYVWPLCKVIEVQKGPDGLVRVVVLKTKNSILRRSIGKFCPLPDFAKAKSAGNMVDRASTK